METIFSDMKLKVHVFRYVFQCGMAGCVIFAILYGMDYAGQNQAIVASLGSSAFVVFEATQTYTARLRSLLGGNFIALLTGSLLSCVIWLSGSGNSAEWSQLRIIVGALAVVISMFFMSITDTEHPPAAGLALGMVISPWFWSNILIVIGAVGFLSMIKKFFSRGLINLY